MMRKFRQTKIVFTIGPASSGESMLVKLIENGVDVCRFNMAHATHEWLFETVARVRRCCDKAGRQIAMMMDVKGPEIRTRDVDSPILLEKEDQIVLAYEPSGQPPRSAEPKISKNGSGKLQRCFSIGVNYPSFALDLQIGQTVLVDSGMIHLSVEQIQGDLITCRVVVPGELGSRRHINLPGVRVNLPALTEKDIGDVRAGVEAGMDYFALSFVREANDLHVLRKQLDALGSRAGIIAKIEDRSGVENLDLIIAAGDGMMVARGDLGIEVPFEELPVFQRNAVNASLSAGKPVIIATHMLESMIHSPVPTRAEITDVSNAVRELADCVMLSGETTVGKYPDLCVEVLNRIIDRLQREHERRPNLRLHLHTPKEKMLRSAVTLAEDVGHAAIMVFTRSGDLARLLSALRPKGCPIYAFSDRPETFRRLLMSWGVEPFLIEFQNDPELTIHNAFVQLRGKGWCEAGDPVVIVTNVLGHADKIIDSMQVRTVE
jgi:pyruvate kinase